METRDQMRDPRLAAPASSQRPASPGIGLDATMRPSAPRSSTPEPPASPAGSAEGGEPGHAHGPSNAGSKPTPVPDAYEAKASAAWKALNNRYGTRLSQVEIDHLHARFVLGLTQPGFGGGPPADHLAACRRLLALDLPPERVESALNDIPPPGEAWVETAFASIETHGERIGRGISSERGVRAVADEGGAAGR